MKLVAEYLHDAVRLEQLAAQERNPEVSGALQKQAHAYRKLAEKRAKELGVPPPDTSGSGAGA
jgi:hypothetical protein